MTRRGTNEGSIYKRIDGRWVGVVHLGYEGGRRRRKNIYGKTRQAVASKLAAAIKARQDGLPLPGDRETVGSFLGGWLENVQPSLRPRTWTRYESLIRIHALPRDRATIAGKARSRPSAEALRWAARSRPKSGLGTPAPRGLAPGITAGLSLGIGRPKRWRHGDGATRRAPSDQDAEPRPGPRTP